MRMTIEGIGKVSSATVPLDGITVVAGENNTGKSTIGKALFAMADGCYDLEQRMIERIRRHIVFAVNSQLPLTGDESLGSRRKTTARVASLVEDYLNHGDGDADGLMQTLRDNDIPLPKPNRRCPARPPSSPPARSEAGLTNCSTRTRFPESAGMAARAR